MIIFSVLLYSRFIGTKGLNTNEYIVTNDSFINYDNFKIIHFTDIHYKKVITKDTIKELINQINKTKPDIVLFTGDLIDKDYKLNNNDINFLITELSKINSKYGIYSILGDNDYQELENIKNIYLQSDITLLDNSSTTIINEQNQKLQIAGISSNLNQSNDISEIIKPENNDIIDYKIILTHEPDNIESILNNYPNTPLILAGHSINGSINIPIIKKLFLPTGAKNYYNPYYKINNTNIYISNGIGVNEINFRFFNTPSINLYRLKKSN